MAEHAQEISNILTRLLELTHISEAELARKVKLPRATINRLTSGRTPDPRASTLNAIADFFDVTVDQLLGKQPLCFDSKSNSTLTKISTSIPIIDIKNCIDWEATINKLKPDNHYDWVTIDSTSDNAKFAVKVNSESMWPQFQMNTILIITPYRKPENRDFVVAYINESNEIIFRQLIIENSYMFLKAINNIFPTIQLKSFDRIIGVVIQTRNSY